MTYLRKNIKGEPVIELTFENEEEYSAFFELFDAFSKGVPSCSEDIKAFIEKFKYRRTLKGGAVTTIAYVQSISTTAIMLCIGLMFDYFAKKKGENGPFVFDDEM